ncbi:MAG: Ppx/GppA family phosphatase [Cycloclasticus sp.]|nr:phosphatase [Cycloclasticus sp. 46_83_sub15_T18]
MTDKNDDSELLAALDLGSNSFHLIIARMHSATIEPIKRVKHRVKLRAGLDKSNELNCEVMLRAVSSLKEMGAIIKETRATKVRVVATHTIREAHNRNAFLTLAERALGFPIEIISGCEEARLIYQGVVQSESLIGRCLVIDIGGGSTEIVVGEGSETHYRESKSMGCLSFTERFFSKELNEKVFKKAEIAALQKLEFCSHRFKKFKWNRGFATSGTAKALLKAVGLVGDHSEKLLLSELLELRELLCQKSGFEKLAWVGIDEARAAVLPAGIAIMIAVMKSLGVSELTFCSAALREGVLLEMESQDNEKSVRLLTRQDMQTRYHVDRKQALQVAETCEHLWHQVAVDWKLEGTGLEVLLVEAAHLYEVGLQISVSDFQSHSGYILANSELPGFNQDEQQLLGVLVSNGRKKFKRRSLPLMRTVSHKVLTRLVRLFRLAVLLNNSRQPLVIDLLRMKVAGSDLQLTIDKDFFLEQALNVADLDKEAKLMAKLGHKLSYQLV